MAVIAFPNLSPQGPNPGMTWELRSITARNQSPLNGVATTLERPGAHWAATLRYENLFGDRRARMQAFLTACRGHGSRFYVPYFGWTNRGSFSAPELFANSSFSSTTGWTPTNATLTANDGQLRITATTPAANVQIAQSVALTQYAPHALRSLLIDGPQTAGLSIGRFIDGNGASTNDYSTSRGMGTLALVAAGGSAVSQFPAVFNATTGFTAGAYLTVGYVSLARCGLVDNGPNLLLRSDEIDNATWTKVRATVTANNAIAPDGSNNGEDVVEDATASNNHHVSQTVTVSSGVGDYSFAVALKQGTRTWAAISIREDTGATEAAAYFNLAAGTIGASTVVGANWANLRSFITNIGSGWYRCTVVARKTGVATSLTGRIYLATGDGGVTYSGDGSSFIRAWRATLALSSVPTRLRQTTSSATTGTLQTGGGVYLKGLPASTNGLLVAGDLAEIVTNASSQLVRARTPLNSDASGLGYFEFEAPLRVSPLDNGAVIIRNPLCRMMLDSNTVQWTERAGGFSDLEFTAVEDTYP